jgi:hypothetical protein
VACVSLLDIITRIIEHFPQQGPIGHFLNGFKISVHEELEQHGRISTELGTMLSLFDTWEIICCSQIPENDIRNMCVSMIIVELCNFLHHGLFIFYIFV